MALPNNKSKLRLTLISRGQGKLFLKFESTGDFDLTTLTPASCLMDGTLMPTEVYESAYNYKIVGIPILTVAQCVTLVSISDGNCVFEHKIGPVPASLSSKFNTVFRKSSVDQIRDLDETKGFPSFDVSMLVHDLTADIINYSLGLNRPAEVSSIDYSCLVLGLDGRVLDDRPISMGSKTCDSDAYPGCKVQVDSWSGRIPSGCDGFILYAFEAKSGNTLAFSVFDTFKTGQLREDWASLTCSADRDPGYEKWFFDCHKTTEFELELQRRSIPDRASAPVFSIIVPLFKTPIIFFHDMVESVLRQTYPYFELVLVNASPENADLCAEAARYAELDDRIKLVTLGGNLGITENTNAGIRVSSGEFIAFFDHDDVLEPDSLYRYADEILRHPETDLIYCDEDHLKDGHYVLPFFKPDWDIDLLCYENYVCHMLTVRRSILEALPELPAASFDGSQDHNMTFLVGEQARRVGHVRKILYHWRIHENSVSGSSGVSQKAYALEAERLSVQNHLDRCGIEAKAVMGKRVPTRCDLEYKFDSYDLVSIIIPNHEACDVLARCVESILARTTWPNYEIVIVENGSKSREILDYYETLSSSYSNIRIIDCRLSNGFDFSRLINCGSKEAKGDYLLYLNNDTEVISPDWIEEMMGLVRRPDVGCVGAKLLYPDNTVQHAGVVVAHGDGPIHVNMHLADSDPGYFETASLPHRLSAVTGACLLTKREVFNQLGGMDEAFPVDYNDIDFCLRAIEAGYGVVYQPYSKLRHYESVSRGFAQSRDEIESFVRSKGKFMDRWLDYFYDGDPYYNCNFAVNSPYYKIE